MLRFLRCEKYRMEDALARLERFFDIQSQWPELYGEFRFETIRGLMEDNQIELMPKCDDNGCAVIIFRVKNWNTRFVYF